MAIAGGITPDSGPLLFKPSTVPIPIYQLWKTNSFNIGQAMIKSVLGSKLICASLRSNDHPRISYGGDFDNEPFWKTMVKDIAWSLKSVAVFLAEQPSQIKYTEWPTFQSTMKTHPSLILFEVLSRNGATLLKAFVKVANMEHKVFWDFRKCGSKVLWLHKRYSMTQKYLS